MAASTGSTVLRYLVDATAKMKRDMSTDVHR